MKKKILIFSYYYPPCNQISGNRVESFATNLSEKYETIVVTRFWNGNEQVFGYYLEENLNNEIKRINENLSIHYLPYKKKKEFNGFFNKLNVVFNYLIGNLNFEDNLVNLNLSYCEKLFTKWKPDLIICSTPPLSLLKLCYILNKKYSIAFLTDFRDFENQIVLNKSTKLKSKDYILFKLREFYTVKYLKKSILNTAINNQFIAFFKAKNILNFKLILNGYKKEHFNNFLNIKNEKFRIISMGTIYLGQDINVFLDGSKMFLCKNPNSKVSFEFYGIMDSDPIKLKIIEKINSVKIFNRINHSEAIIRLCESDVLFYPTWVNYNGMYSGKIFEYLGAKRNILIAPSDDDVIEALLKETNAGEVANTPEEVCAYLERKYFEWEKNGFLSYDGIEEKINFYSRENQASILHKEIEKILQ
jgi:hypothetical protein